MKFIQKYFTPQEKKKAKKLVKTYIASDKPISNEDDWESYCHALPSQFYFYLSDDAGEHNPLLGLEHPMHFPIHNALEDESTFQINFIDKEDSDPDLQANHCLQDILPDDFHFPTEYYAEMERNITVREALELLLAMGFEYSPKDCIFGSHDIPIKKSLTYKSPKNEVSNLVDNTDKKSHHEYHMARSDKMVREQKSEAILALKNDDIRRLSALVEAGFDVNTNFSDDKPLLLKAYTLGAQQCIDYLWTHNVDIFVKSRPIATKILCQDNVDAMELIDKVGQQLDNTKDKYPLVEHFQELSDFFYSLLEQKNNNATKKMVDMLKTKGDVYPLILSQMTRLSRQNATILIDAIRHASDQQIKNACIDNLDAAFVVNYILSQRPVDLSQENKEGVSIGEYLDSEIELWREKVNHTNPALYVKSESGEFVSELATRTQTLHELQKLKDRIFKITSIKLKK